MTTTSPPVKLSSLKRPMGAIAAATLTLTACGGGGSGNVAVAPTLASAAVSVSGNQILLDGSPGALNGFTFVGRLNPTACAAANYQGAWANWSAAELKVARDAFHANTVRIQVAEALLYGPALDPAYVAGYIAEVADAVALVRSTGMVAMVSMQWEQSGSQICDENGVTAANLSGVPDATTDSAWNALLTSAAWTRNSSQSQAPQDLGADHGVVLEVFNEPDLGGEDGTAAQWSDWQAVLQQRVDFIRALGVANVLVIPAMSYDHMLDATAVGGLSLTSSLLDDSLGSLIYAMHPYPAGPTPDGANYIGEFSAADWNRWWGGLVPTVAAPIIVTEWYTGGFPNSHCWDAANQPPTAPFGMTEPTNFSSPVIAAQFLSWLRTAGPGGQPMSLAGAWPFDLPGYLVQDLSTDAPTFFDASFACGVQVPGASGATYEGPGQLIQAYFGSL